LKERRDRKRDDSFDRSLNSVINSVVITLFDEKKRRWSSAVEGDAKAPFSLVALSGKRRGRLPSAYFVGYCFTNLG